jgi:hypothetical protein
MILPAVSETNPSAKISTAGLGIFGIALLTAGFSLTALLCFAVRNPLFQVDAVFVPSLIASFLGLVTVLFDFMVFDRYTWGTPSLLLTIAGAVTGLTYGSFLILALRRIRSIKKGASAAGMMPHSSTTGLVLEEVENGRWQEPSYYDNYVRNMFPTSINPPGGRSGNNNNRSGASHNPNVNTAYDPNSITEEEMQRQQMLMLLLQRDQPARTSNSERTFHIDWQQGRDEDDGSGNNTASSTLATGPPPSRGYYAPPQPHHGASQSVSSINTTYAPHSTSSTMQQPPPLIRRITSDLQPWDGVWRTAAPAAAPIWERHGREARRAEIERGR